jgi:hypothetical protein
MSETESTLRRTRWILAISVAVIAVIVISGVIWAVAAAGNGGVAHPTATETRSAPPPSPGTDGGSTPGAIAEPPPGTDPPVPPELAPVAPDQQAVGDDGMRVRIDRIESVEGEAFSPGEIAGPAVRVTITIENDTDQPLDLGLTAVNAYVGPDRAPAGRLTEPGGVPFEGVLEPGESGSAVMLFTVAESDRDEVTITVDYSVDVSTIVFQGSLR